MPLDHRDLALIDDRLFLVLGQFRVFLSRSLAPLLSGARFTANKVRMGTTGHLI